ncbi:amidohydrolase family protein [Actinopolymorpha pittospori]|uniref:TIM-barrel fold metal-dependent hydrolase n=1 Tax=Actinopolymorpha pittospori TaxID=648752 RepID=A0A927NCX1_9ACTN|nr:amidohydrolase family protein [Actinopolymorpha pittospori]MBE1613212.1 putative TIM-barrel fold metal-dependent hydrolase [Actinopolymorpha pittospori]
MTAVTEAPRHTRTRPVQVGIVDCDTHNYWDDQSELKPFLDPRWHEHLDTLGLRRYSGGSYPRFWDDAIDTRPPSGRRSGSDVGFMGTDLLDRHHIAYAVLIPLTSVSGLLNLDLANAMATAINDWQAAQWLDKDDRMRASISVATEDPVAAAAEVRRVAQDRRFVQVQFSGRPAEPMGRRRYWPIYEACAEFGIPVMSHAFGSSGQPITGAGWASYYIEDHVGPAISVQANIVSMIMEGVFDRFPGLRLVSVENGFAWAASLRWRMDQAFELLRSEVPHLSRRPSEYFEEHVYLATQPVEEPEKREYFQQMLEQYPGYVDRLLFSSDYPHWDGDAPNRAVPLLRDPEARDKVLRRNARRLYGLA